MIKKLIEDFIKFANDNAVEIYNEFSLQYELGIYLRNKLPNYKVQFERNISYFYGNSDTIKKEIDIVVFNKDEKEKYAIELKYPRNRAYTRRMYQFIQDIKFMEELKELGFDKTYCFSLVQQKPFYKGKTNNGIYNYFRGDCIINGEIKNPINETIKKNPDFIFINGNYNIKWINFDEKRKYYLLEI